MTKKLLRPSEMNAQMLNYIDKKGYKYAIFEEEGRWYIKITGNDRLKQSIYSKEKIPLSNGTRFDFSLTVGIVDINVYSKKSSFQFFNLDLNGRN